MDILLRISKSCPIKKEWVEVLPRISESCIAKNEF